MTLSRFFFRPALGAASFMLFAVTASLEAAIYQTTPTGGTVDWFNSASWVDFASPAIHNVPDATTTVRVQGIAQIFNSEATALCASATLGFVELTLDDETEDLIAVSTPGRVEVSDSKWLIAGNDGLGTLSLGYAQTFSPGFGGAANGELSITNGGSVTVTTLNLGVVSGAFTASGVVTVSGVGSKLQTNGFEKNGISNGAVGTITISDGGLWNATADIFLAAGKSLTISDGGVVTSTGGLLDGGNVTINGTNSNWNVTGDLVEFTGGQTQAVFRITEGGSASAGGTFNVSHVEISGQGSKLDVGYLVVQKMHLDSSSIVTIHGDRTGGRPGEVVLGGSLTIEGGAQMNADKRIWVDKGATALMIQSGGVLTSVGAAPTGIGAEDTMAFIQGGVVSIDGAGSKWEHTGAVHAGNSTVNLDVVKVEINTSNGGLLHVTDNLFLTGQANDDVTLNVQSGSTLQAGLVAIGIGKVNATISGTLQTREITRDGGVSAGTKLVFSGATWEIVDNKAYSTSGLDVLQGYTTIGNERGFRDGEILLEGAGVTFLVDTHPTTAEPYSIVVSASMSGAGGVTKTGVGRLLLSGKNTFTGDVVVTEGILELNADSLSEAVTIRMVGGQLALNGSVSVSGLYVDGVDYAAGTYSAADMSWISSGEITVIPEPTTYALYFGVALTALVGARRKRIARSLGML